MSSKAHYNVLAICRALKRQGMRCAVIQAIQDHYHALGISLLPSQLHTCPSEASSSVAVVVLESIEWDDSHLLNGLCSMHWLMRTGLRADLINLGL